MSIADQVNDSGSVGLAVERSIPGTIRTMLGTTGLPARALADALHMNKNRLSERMNHKAKFTIAELVEIAAFFDAPTTVFFDRAELGRWVQNWKDMNPRAGRTLTLAPPLRELMLPGEEWHRFDEAKPHRRQLAVV